MSLLTIIQITDIMYPLSVRFSFKICYAQDFPQIPRNLL